ncbi:hypothetical protein SAY87_019441 [Trapa incisa]|uniref:Elongation factor P C-terminal domain-containing protein n=1 Tax=Trapa incisa TaxID=236973 RepID=A0AAN7K7K1_9MYRT|nr:hypothetical protein SAY87_019441 [Trapa incisa]
MDVKKDLFGKNAAYLKEEMKVTLRLFDDKPLSGSVPKRVICTVKETPPPLKGVSATPVYAQFPFFVLIPPQLHIFYASTWVCYMREKRALLDNGLTVKVPAFIETGEAILVSTDHDSYISRAKEWHADT